MRTGPKPTITGTGEEQIPEFYAKPAVEQFSVGLFHFSGPRTASQHSPSVAEPDKFKKTLKETTIHHQYFFQYNLKSISY